MSVPGPPPGEHQRVHSQFMTAEESTRNEPQVQSCPHLTPMPLGETVRPGATSGRMETSRAAAIE